MPDDSPAGHVGGGADAANETRRRVVIGGLTPLLSGLVRALLDTVPCVDVVSQLDDVSAIVEVAGDLRADVAVIGADCRALWPELLHAQPALTVLSVSVDGGSGQVVELRPVERQLGELSRHVLAAAVEGTGTWADRFS